MEEWRKMGRSVEGVAEQRDKGPETGKGRERRGGEEKEGLSREKWGRERDG